MEDTALKSKPRHLLLVDDDLPTLKILELIFAPEGYTLSLASSGKKALSLLRQNLYDVVLSDIQLGDMCGLDLLSIAKETNPNGQIVFITGQGDIETAVKSLQAGAFEYVPKALDLNEMTKELTSVVRRAVVQKESLENATTSETTPASLLPNKMIGRSPEMGRVFRSIAKAAMSQSNVLITGESGTGKELVAIAIHQNSGNSDKPFVTVNCGALTETLLESELFGYVKGAFTGALGNKRGLFEEANGGTIFLDEIGDISPSLQVKLLRVLQEGEIKPVGSNENRRVEVRVIAATHRDLPALVRKEAFREDLYYRLKVISIDIAPLRKRVQDIPDLANYFLRVKSPKNGKPFLKISDTAMEYLCSYPWPGNVRELENAIECAIAMSTASVLFPEDFHEEVPRLEHHDSPETEHTASSSKKEPSVLHSLDEVEKEHILKTLREVKFNKSKAAQLLGIDRVTLYRKVLRYSIPSSPDSAPN